MQIRRLLLGPMIAGAVACSSSSSPGSSGGGALSGTVDGVSFTVASQLALTSVLNPNNGSGQILDVALINRTATCNVASNVEFANLDALNLGVFVSSGKVTTGTYPVVPEGGAATSGAQPGLTTTNGQCAYVVNDTATGGSVTISTLTSTSVTGTFDVTFGSDGSFTGSFDATLCATSSSSPVDGGEADAGTVCMP